MKTKRHRLPGVWVKYWSNTGQLEMPAEPIAEPDPVPSWPRRGQWIAHVIACLIGVAGLACSLALPFAPVWADHTEVHWPGVRAPGTESASTTALLAPYRPASFDATVPCPVLRTALGEPKRTTVLTTLPPGSDREGLVLSTLDRKVELVLNQRTVPLPTGSCGLSIHADDRQSVVTTGTGPPIVLPGVPAPEIFTFASDLTYPQLNGVSVSARTFAWADTTATGTKRELIGNALLLAAFSLLLLVLNSPPTLSALRRITPREALMKVAPWLWPIDVAVVAIMLGWLVIGPLTDDDGFAMMTIRNYAATGDIGNYYRWFNASETPFTLVQHMMRWVAEYSLAPAWLRVPSLIAGVLSWFILTRGIVEPVCRGANRLALRLLTALFFLTCWLPYGLGIRPEPFVSLGIAGLVAALLKMSRSQVALGWLGLAALLTGLTVAITPGGFAAVLIVLVNAPRISRVLARKGTLPRWFAIPTRVVLLACLGAVGLVAMFADTTIGGVMEATRIHDEFGPSMGWYQEISRYTGLLGSSAWGAAGKRMVVLLVVTAALIAGAGAMRQAHRWTSMPDLPVLLGAVAAVLATLWLTPSKWSHHFGTLAAVGPALLTATVVLLVWLGQITHARREARLLGVFGTLAAAVAAALAFSGPNEWPWQSDLGMSWSDTPVRPGLPLDNPALWVIIGAAAGLTGLTVTLVRLQFWRIRPKNLMFTVAPVSVLSLAAFGSVLVLLGSFLAAPRAMGDRFSVARMNEQSIQAESCGLESEVDVLPVSEALTPLDEDDGGQLDGFTVGGAPPKEPDLREVVSGEPLRRPEPPDPADPLADEVQPRAATELTWTSRKDGPQGTGSLISPWFGLPITARDETLSVWVSGRPEQGNALAVEFAHGDHPVGIRELRDPPPKDLPFQDPRQGRPKDWRDFTPWRLLTVEATEIPPGADRIRLLATDGSTDKEGWLEIGAPVIRDIVPLRQALQAASPTLIDWNMSFVFPCWFDYPQVGRGLANSPRFLITPPEGEASMAYDPELGGVFAGVPKLGERLEMPTRLRNAGGFSWGHLYAVRYDRERDAYPTSTWRSRIGGMDSDPAYPFKAH